MSGTIKNKKAFDFFNGKSVLITGSSGLIGGNLLRFFDSMIIQGSSLCLHSILRGFSETSFVSNHSKNYSLDLCKDSFENILPKFDVIFHCAGYGQPKKFLRDQLATISLNTSVLIKLIGCLEKQGKIIYLSSSEVYSGFDGEFPSENDIGNTTPEDFRACYIEGKRCGEAIINTLKNSSKSGVSIRLALAYGPGTKKDDDRVLNQFIKSSIISKNITLLDEGKLIRRYLFINDAIDMIINIASKGEHQVYNVGGIERISILELAKIIQNITGCSIDVPKIPNGLIGAPANVGLDIKRYLNEFGEIDFLSLEEGLRHTIRFYKETLSKQ
jgi:UDP-glucuronate decarboxylase